MWKRSGTAVGCEPPDAWSAPYHTPHVGCGRHPEEVQTAAAWRAPFFFRLFRLAPAMLTPLPLPPTTSSSPSTPAPIFPKALRTSLESNSLCRFLSSAATHHPPLTLSVPCSLSPKILQFAHHNTRQPKPLILAAPGRAAPDARWFSSNMIRSPSRSDTTTPPSARVNAPVSMPRCVSRQTKQRCSPVATIDVGRLSPRRKPAERLNNDSDIQQHRSVGELKRLRGFHRNSLT